MKIVEVLIEHATSSFHRPFFYIYQKQEEIVPGLRVLVPLATRQVLGYVLSVQETAETVSEVQERTGYLLKEILTILDKEPLLSDALLVLAKQMQAYYKAPLIHILQTMLPPSLKPKLSALKQPKIAYQTFVVLEQDSEEDLTVKQKEFLRFLKRVERCEKKDVSPTILKALLAKKRVKLVYEEKMRLAQETICLEDKKTLNSEQEAAVRGIFTSEQTIHLLQGVTGSGKTEVYLQLAEKYIEQKKTVLMLVPEIALTVAMVARFRRRFPAVAILHSHLTPAEKYDEYRKIRRGDAPLVVGARSAIFAPLPHLGCIILDEEHVETYKQETSPYYHARTVAQMRQAIEGCKIILGSATPSLETKARAMRNVYGVFYLRQRIYQQILPKTSIINLLSSKEIDQESIILSKVLRAEIAKNLQQQQQTLLLLNRRGYAPFLTCRRCGKVFRCPDCGLLMTVHREDHFLKCHHCGHIEELVETCPKCGSDRLLAGGFGSERVEQEVKRLFPEARVLRLDSDTAKARLHIQKTLEAFERQDADILIGTQMIAKGHDFPKVTLVGIVLADIGLTIPSYRSAERTFDLITQAIGRAGRADEKGRAILQTYSPQHYVITLSAVQDYETFFLKEMGYRKLQQYPPYTFCTILTIASRKEEEILSIGEELKQYLQACFAQAAVDIIGPTRFFLEKKDGFVRRKILLKYKDFAVVSAVLDDLQERMQGKKQVQMTINVDPFEDY